MNNKWVSIQLLRSKLGQIGWRARECCVSVWKDLANCYIQKDRTGGEFFLRTGGDFGAQELLQHPNR